MRVSVVIAPGPVVSWEDADRHLNLFGDESERVMIEGMLAAATATLDGPDGWLGRALGKQTLELAVDGFADAINLPFPPLLDIVSVQHLDQAGAVATLDPADYEVRGQTLRPAFGRTWPNAVSGSEAVRVRYRAGYDQIPAQVRAAILLMLGDLYRFRETAASGTMTTIPMSTTVENLLGSLRVYR